jgi:sulfate permease, SulP family
MEVPNHSGSTEALLRGGLVKFRPKLLDCLKDYSSQKFFSDLTAGLTVGVVALPLAMAFGIASGVKPEAGIFTAVIAGFLISALGGSRVQIGGPTGAFIVIVLGIIQQYGLDNLLVCTVMAGVMLVFMGATGLGNMIKFIPYPVTSGFTTGIAVLIMSTQIKDFLGLQVDQVPGDFFAKIEVLGAHLKTIHPPAVALSLSSLFLILLWPKKWGRRIPGSIIAVVAGTTLIMWLESSGHFARFSLETIGTKFNGIPQGLPAFRMPDLSLENLKHLIMPALTIALLAGIESLLSAVVADGLINDKHDSNQELMAQGIANIACPFFGGIPATGAIARTATNIRNGAQSPVAGIIHALTLLIIILIAAPLAKSIPLATLSAILIVVALNMGEWHEFTRLRKLPKSDAGVLLITFLLTVLTDLTIAVGAGMIMAAMLFIKRVSETTQIIALNETTESESPQNSIVGKEIPKGVLIYRVMGALLFGATEKLETALKTSRQEPEVLILEVSKAMAIDATGLNALENIHERLKGRGKQMVLCGPHTQPYMMMDRAGFLERLGHENVVADIDEALTRSRKILKLPDTRPVEHLH